MKLSLLILGLFISMNIVHGEDNIFKKNISIGPCNYDPNEFKETSLAYQTFKITKNITCNPAEINKNFRYSDEYCKLVVSCRTSTFADPANAEKLKKVDLILNAAIAKDLVKNVVEKSSDKMEAIEALKLFAKEKLHLNSKIEKACNRVEIKVDKNKCNYSLLTQNFEEQQNSCKSSIMKGCFIDDNTQTTKALSYNNFKKTAKKTDTSLMADYLKYRAEKRSAYFISSDEESLNKIGTLVTSSKFINSNADQKAELFLTLAASDPVIGYEVLTSDKKNKTAKSKLESISGLVALYSKSKLNKASFIKSFSQLRESHANVILTGKNPTCANVPSVNWLCKEMYGINNGDVLRKASTDLTEKFSYKFDDEEITSRAKSLSDDLVNSSNILYMIDAKTCLTYDMPRPMIDFTSKKYLGSIINTNKYGDYDDNYFSNQSSDNSALTSIDWMKDIRVAPETATATPSENVAKIQEDFGASNVAPTAPIGSSATAAAIAPTSVQPNNEMNNSFNDFKNSDYSSQIGNTSAYSSAIPTDSENAGKIEKVKSGKNTANDERVDELSKKLAIAEDNIAKMKAASEDAENERIKQKKIEDDEKAIKDLKAQISELNAQKAKKLAEKNAINSVSSKKEESADSSDDTAVVAAKTENIQRKNVDVYDPYIRREDQDIIDSENEARRSAKSSSVKSGSTSAASPALEATSDSNTIVLASGQVITLIDGMTDDKAKEVISDRIIALQGTPFLISEHGTVKEVIAIVIDGKLVLDKDGNPTFEKIIKGKVSDSKFSASKSKDRVPAAKKITDAADLKRDQEEKLKRERVEYLKLKSLTNGILNRK